MAVSTSKRKQTHQEMVAHLSDIQLALLIDEETQRIKGDKWALSIRNARNTAMRKELLRRRGV